jgi:hypothetical protein
MSYLAAKFGKIFQTAKYIFVFSGIDTAAIWKSIVKLSLMPSLNYLFRSLPTITLFA